MESRLQKLDLCDLKAVKLTLNDPNISSDPNVICKFLSGSKVMLKEYSQDGIADESCFSDLCEWYSVLESVLQVMYHHAGSCPESHWPGLEMILSFLNHIMFYLIKIKGIPSKWLIYCGSAALEFLACYKGTESHKEDFANAIAQKSYCFLCSVGQAMLKQSKKSKDSLGDYYQLCLIGCAFLNLDSSKTGESATQMAKNFLSNFNQLAESGEKKLPLKNTEIQQRQTISKQSLIIYCTKPSALNEIDCLFIVEMFRLVVNCPDLLQEFIDSNGNLFHMDLVGEGSPFPCNEIKLLQQRMGTESQADLNKNLHKIKITIAICSFVNCLNSMENKKENVDSDQMEEHILQILNHVKSTTSQGQSLASKDRQLLTESISLLVSKTPDLPRLSTSVLLSYHHLLSKCTEIFARDTLIVASDSKPNKTSAINQHTYNLAVLNKTRMQTLQQLVCNELNENDLAPLAADIKSSLNHHCMLAQTTKKKALLAPETTAYKQIFKSLNNAFTSIGAISRHLRRLEKHNANIVILSPIWPITSIPELLPSLSHHESLCEAYRISGNVTTACQVISQAACLHRSLVTPPLVKSLIKIAKTNGDLNIPSLFSRCEDKGLDLLLQFIKMVTVYRNNAALAKHLEIVLRHVLNTNQLDPSEEALANLVLGESCWCDKSSLEEKDKATTEALGLVQNSVKWFMRDEKTNGDFLAQALFLEAEIQHTLACLSQAELESCSSGANSDNDPEEHTNFSTVPGLISDDATDIESQAPLDIRPNSSRAFDSFQTPTAGPTRANIKLKPKKLNMDKFLGIDVPEEKPKYVDNSNLLEKAHSAFTCWKVWYNCCNLQEYLVTSTLKEKEEYTFRLERSLAFLQRLAQVAVVNHQPVFAIDCLTQAHLLGKTMDKTNLLANLKSIVLPHMGKLGLVPSTMSEITEKDDAPRNGEERGLAEIMSCLEEELAKVTNSDKEEDGTALVPLATYFYSTNQHYKCLQILSTLLRHFEFLKQKAPLTASTSLVLMELKRLTAEISSSHESEKTYGVLGLEVPYPLEAISEAVKYITSVAVHSMGVEFKETLGKGMFLNSWLLIHEYLSTIRLCSKLFLEVGNIKYARTYLQEGLKLSKSCLLDSWRSIFLSSLAHMSVHGFDSVSQAESFAKDAVEAVNGVLAVPCSEEGSLTSLPPEDDILDNMLPLEDGWSSRQQECLADCDLCALQLHSSSFNPALMKANIELLWTEAEIALHNDGNKTKALRLLYLAFKFCSHLNRFPVHKFVNKITDTLDANMSFDLNDIHWSQLLHLETLLKIAKVSFQALIMSVNHPQGEGAESCPQIWTESQKKEVQKIKEICQTVLTSAKTLIGLGNTRIMMASAQLLKLQLDYLPCWCKENYLYSVNQEKDEEIDLSVAVKELKIDQDYWNAERQQMLKSEFQKPGITPVSRPGKDTQRQSSGRISLKSPWSISQPNDKPEKNEGASFCTPSMPQMSPKKHGSTLFNTENEGTAVKCSKPISVQKSKSSIKAGSKSVRNGKPGSRSAGKSSQLKPMPVLSIVSSSRNVYNEIYEDEETPVKSTPMKDAAETSLTSRKLTKRGRQRASRLREQISVNESPSRQDTEVKHNNSGSDLSPLSRELSELNICGATEENLEQNENCSQQGTCNKKKDKDFNQKEKRTGRGNGRSRAAAKAKDVDEKSIPNIENDGLSSPCKKKITHRKVKGVRDNTTISHESDVSHIGVPDNTEESNCNVKVTSTRQSRRRKKVSEVGSPEKKREIESFLNEDGGESPWTPHNVVSSPMAFNLDFHTGDNDQQIFCDEEVTDRNQWYEDPVDSLSPLAMDPGPDNLRDNFVLSKSFSNHFVGESHNPVTPNLWPPVEIPRGHPRRVINKKENTHADSGTQLDVSVRKKSSPITRRKKKRKSVEISRGLDDEDDDDDKENVGTPGQTERVKADQPPRTGRRAGTSKLSLKKKKSVKEDIVCDKECPVQVAEVLSPEDIILVSDDEKQTPSYSSIERESCKETVEEDDPLYKCAISRKPGKGLTTKNGSGIGVSNAKLSKRGQKKICSIEVKEEGKELETSVHGKKKSGKTKGTASLRESCEEDVDDITFSNTDIDPRISIQFLTAPQDELFEKDIQETLNKLKAFPPSFLYSQLSKWLALTLWNRSVHVQDNASLKKDGPSLQMSVAAFLTESMHVSFYHMLTRNLHHKLRRCRENKNLPENSKLSKTRSKKDETLCAWSTLDEEEVKHEMALLRQVLKMGQRDMDTEDAFESRLHSIPQDWTVVQMSLVNFGDRKHQGGQILITRMTSNSQPLTVGIPLERWKHLTQLMKAYSEAIKYDVSELDAEQYWTRRYERDQIMKDLVFLLQEQFLSGHKWLLCGKPTYINDSIEAILNDAVKCIKEQLVKVPIDERTVRCVLEVLLSANEKDINSVLQCLWPHSIACVIANVLWDVQVEAGRLTPMSLDPTVARKPVILLLDKIFNELPWESMPILSEDTVTRVPSLNALDSLLTLHNQRQDSPFLTGVNRNNVVAVIDPEINLQNCVNVLKPQFQKYKGWTCLTQQAPTIADLKSFLRQELYIYNGHGWGRKFFGGDDLQMFRAKAVAIIMGCHSGKMDFKSKTDGDGAPLYFLLAGCPAVLGNLWLVTDKDIDNLTSHMMSFWMSCRSPTSLSHILNKARKVCKLQGLNGYAPVIYGLPVLMN